MFREHIPRLLLLLLFLFFSFFFFLFSFFFFLFPSLSPPRIPTVPFSYGFFHLVFPFGEISFLSFLTFVCVFSFSLFKTAIQEKEKRTKQVISRKKKILPVAKKKKEKKKKSKGKYRFPEPASQNVRNDKTEINMDGMIGKRPRPVDVQGAKRAGRAVNLDAAIGSLREGEEEIRTLVCEQAPKSKWGERGKSEVLGIRKMSFGFLAAGAINPCLQVRRRNDWLTREF